MKKFFTLAAAMLVAGMASAEITDQSCYVIGEVNDQGWDPAVGVEMTKVEDGVFTATVDVKGWFGFVCELAADWDTLNAQRLFPANGESNVDLVDGKAVIDLAFDKSGGDAWTLGAAAEGVKFTVNYNEMTLTVEAGAVEIDEDIYVVGDLTGWQFDPAYKTTNNNGVYTIENVSIQGGFKLANPGWGKYNYGCHYEVAEEDAEGVPVQPTLNEAYEVLYNGGNLVINDDVEATFVVTLTLDLTGEKPMLTIAGDSGIENVAAENAAAIYYNLQGVQVANPANGLYIVKQGNNVSKVLVK